MAWQTFDGLTLTGLSPSSLVGTDANKQLATNSAQLTPDLLGVVLGRGLGGPGGAAIFGGAGGVTNALRIYGAAALGAHQWDLWQSGIDVRFTDNSGQGSGIGGSVQFDNGVRMIGLGPRLQGDAFLCIDRNGNVHRAILGPNA